MIFKVPLSRGGLILLLSFPQALNTEFRVQRWPGMISMNRPEMESRSYELLLHHLLRIFQFVVIHTVKGFGVVSEAEVNVFWNSLAFSRIQHNVYYLDVKAQRNRSRKVYDLVSWKGVSQNIGGHKD